MRFQLDHDWQGNMSAPRAQLGDAAKNTTFAFVMCDLDICRTDWAWTLETA